MVANAGASSSRRRQRVSGTVNGVELYDVHSTAASVARGHPLCAFMRTVFTSCSTVIPPAIASHLELDSPFLFHFFCRLAEIPGLQRIDALALARGDLGALDAAIAVIRQFIGFERLADICLEEVNRARRPRRPDVFRFQDIKRSHSVSSYGSSPRRRLPYAPEPTSSSVPNAFLQSARRSSRHRSPQKSGESVPTFSSLSCPNSNVLLFHFSTSN